MKYYVSAIPDPVPLIPEWFDAALGRLEDKVNDATLDRVFGFLEGSGFSITNADSHAGRSS